MKKPSVNKIPSATATEPYFERGNGEGFNSLWFFQIEIALFSRPVTYPFFYGCEGDGPMLLGPSSSTQFEDDPDFQSMEEYWEDAPLDDSGDFDFFDAADFSPGTVASKECTRNLRLLVFYFCFISSEDHAEMGASYLQAFLGFMDTQTHLPLMCLLFQWIRCNDEMWGFCLAVRVVFVAFWQYCLARVGYSGDAKW